MPRISKPVHTFTMLPQAFCVHTYELFAHIRVLSSDSARFTAFCLFVGTAKWGRKKENNRIWRSILQTTCSSGRDHWSGRSGWHDRWWRRWRWLESCGSTGAEITPDSWVSISHFFLHFNLACSEKDTQLTMNPVSCSSAFTSGDLSEIHSDWHLVGDLDLNWPSIQPSFKSADHHIVSFGKVDLPQNDYLVFYCMPILGGSSTASSYYQSWLWTTTIELRYTWDFLLCKIGKYCASLKSIGKRRK